MVENTPNHQLNKYEEGEANWSHTPDMEKIEERLVIRDTEEKIDGYKPYDGAIFIASDTGAVYDGNGSTWVEADRNFASIGIGGDFRSSWPDENGAAISSLKINVPTDEDTVADAVNFALKRNLSRGGTIVINIESGHEWQERIDIEDGTDSSYITITSEDSTVPLQSGYSDWLLNVRRYSRGPIWDILLDGGGNTNVQRCYRVRRGSSGYISPGSGFKDLPNAYGIDVRQDGRFNAEGSICNNLARGANPGGGSIANLKDSDFSECEVGIRSTDAFMDARNIKLADCGRGFRFDNVSVVRAQNLTVTGTVNQSVIDHGSVVHLRGSTFKDNPVNIRMLNVKQGSTAILQECEFNNNSDDAVYIRGGSRCHISGTDIRNTDGAGIRLRDGSTANIVDSNVKDSRSGRDIQCENGSIIHIRDTATTTSSGSDPHENDMTIKPNTLEANGIIFAPSTES